MSMPTVESGIFSCSCACFSSPHARVSIQVVGKDGGDQTPFRPGAAKRLAVRPPPPPGAPNRGARGWTFRSRSTAVKLTNKRAGETKPFTPSPADRPLAVPPTWRFDTASLCFRRACTGAPLPPVGRTSFQTGEYTGSTPVPIRRVFKRSTTPTTVFTWEPGGWIGAIIFPLIGRGSGCANGKVPATDCATIRKPPLSAFGYLHYYSGFLRDAPSREAVAQQMKQIPVVSVTLTIVTGVARGQPLERLNCLFEFAPIETSAFGIDSIYTSVASKSVVFLRDRAFGVAERSLELPDGRPRGSEGLRVDQFLDPEMLKSCHVTYLKAVPAPGFLDTSLGYAA